MKKIYVGLISFIVTIILGLILLLVIILTFFKIINGGFLILIFSFFFFLNLIGSSLIIINDIEIIIYKYFFFKIKISTNEINKIIYREHIGNGASDELKFILKDKIIITKVYGNLKKIKKIFIYFKNQGFETEIINYDIW